MNQAFDMQCPYCGSGQDVCHDDQRGYEEDVLHEHYCTNCDKSFVFTTMISFNYYPQKADCLNDGNHKYRMTMTYPRRFSKMRCDECGRERQPTPDELAAVLKED